MAGVVWVAAGSCEACEVITGPGYAILAACLGVAVVLLMRAFPHSSARAVTKAGNQARSG